MNSTNQYVWDFFIAHAGPDKAIAEQLHDRLNGDSRPFVDSRNLQLGDDWDLALRHAQQKSLVTVVLISARTEKAYYQREEIAAAIELARTNDEHRVVPIYLDGEVAASESVPYGLRLKHGITLSDSVGLAHVQEALLRLKSQIQSRPGDYTIRSAAPQPDLVLNVGIKNPDSEPWELKETTIEYKTQRTADDINISPSMAYLDRYADGGPIEPIKCDHVPFTWDFPNLDLKIVNNSHRTVFLTEVRFDIEQSKPDLTPLLLIRPDTYGSNALHFWVDNQGWGIVRDLKARFHLIPLDQGTGDVPYVEPFPHEVAVEDFQESTNINIASAFEACGVNLSAVRNLSLDRSYSYETYLQKLRDILSPFTKDGAIVSGELKYKYSDADREEHWHAVKFSTIVRILYDERQGAPQPPTYQYATKFAVDQANYQRSVSVSHVLKPGEADRFNIKIGVDRSSVHSFRLALVHNDGQELFSPTVRMSTFIPRSGARWVDNRNAQVF